MDRLYRFHSNAGIQGCVFSGIVAVAAAFGIAHDLRVGQWFVTLPLLLAVIGLTYAIRRFLVDNISILRIVMKSFAIVGMVTVVLLPKIAGPDPLWVRSLITGFLGTYMGCYFWMLSDDRLTLT